jgi:hypothetical protein
MACLVPQVVRHSFSFLNHPPFRLLPQSSSTIRSTSFRKPVLLPSFILCNAFNFIRHEPPLPPALPTINLCDSFDFIPMNRCFPLVYRRLLTLSPTTLAIRMSCLGWQPGGMADRGFTSTAIVGGGSSDAPPCDNLCPPSAYSHSVVYHPLVSDAMIAPRLARAVSLPRRVSMTTCILTTASTTASPGNPPLVHSQS